MALQQQRDRDPASIVVDSTYQREVQQLRDDYTNAYDCELKCRDSVGHARKRLTTALVRLKEAQETMKAVPQRESFAHPDITSADGAVVSSKNFSRVTSKRQLEESVSQLQREYDREDAAWQAACAATMTARSNLHSYIRNPTEKGDAPPAPIVPGGTLVVVGTPVVPYDERERKRAEDQFKKQLSSLESTKPVSLRSAELSPERRVLIHEAYPQVPRDLDANLQHIPLSEESLRATFLRLDDEKKGMISVKRVQRYFSENFIGVVDVDSYVKRTLHGYDVVGSEDVAVGDLTYEEFCVLSSVQNPLSYVRLAGRFVVHIQ